MAEYQKRQIKIAHFENLVAVAFSDGFLDKDEAEFLKEKAEELGIDQIATQRVLDSASDLSFQIPATAEECEEQIENAVYVAMINGKLHKKEYDLCVSIARRMGYEEQEVSKIVELVKKLSF